MIVIGGDDDEHASETAGYCHTSDSLLFEPPDEPLLSRVLRCCLNLEPKPYNAKFETRPIWKLHAQIGLIVKRALEVIGDEMPSLKDVWSREHGRNCFFFENEMNELMQAVHLGPQPLLLVLGSQSYRYSDARSPADFEAGTARLQLM